MKFDRMSIKERKEKSLKIIHMGFPMYFYEEENILWGFWSFIYTLFPFTAEDLTGELNFVFLVYEGSYWKALWKFLKGEKF